MTARTVAVIRGADKLRIDGKEFNLNNRKKPFPRIKDEESGLTLMEALVKRLVAREPSLAEDEPFSVAFADYAPDDPEEGEDPLDGRTSGYGEGPAG